MRYATLDSGRALDAALASPGAARTVAVPVDVGWVPAALALALLCWRFLPRRPRPGGRTARAAVAARP